MGGRSRKESEYSDNWSWLGNISNDRLENYGKMTAYKIDSMTSNEQHNSGKSTLNWYMTKEYQKRNGSDPWWKR